VSADGGIAPNLAAVLAGGLPSGAQQRDNAFEALALLAASLNLKIDPEAAAHELGIVGRPATAHEILRAAAKVGLQLRWHSSQGRGSLEPLRRPYLLRRRDGMYWVVVPARRTGHVYVNIPGAGHREAQPAVPIAQLYEEWSGDIFVISSYRDSLSGTSAGQGLHWLLQTLWRYRRSFTPILVASCFVQVFALATPLLFQVVIDKVLVHQSVSTLLVIVFALLAVGLFDVVLQYLRTYALAHTSNRLDAELGSSLFRHLFKLPLTYFESRPTGQTVARVRELENIRSFFTGQGLTSIIDIVFAAVFLAVLLQYSLTLTIVVLASIPLYVVVAAVFRPLLRAKLIERYNLGALNQQILVEAIVGAHTIKSAAAEPLIERLWSDRLASYLRASFQAHLVASGGQNSIQYLSKITTALLLFFGANEVIEGRLTVGGLVAFNMISQQVFAPILRLSQLWQDFQQVQVSVDRVGDIFRTAPEELPARPRKLKALKGGIRFHDVYFRYSSETPFVLQGIDLEVPAGQMLGIVGLSGSGKSTLAKLIQRLYVPDRGRLTVDGVDMAQLDPYWLRRQMGVVLQDNLLFNMSIRDNIAFAAPNLDAEEVLSLARLSGVDEFVAKMPQGYDSQVVERGANLSGGQRQRIAIARALTRDPRILILDEATSSLDYESERIIRNNMRQIGAGRTVLVIAHRLAAVRHCDRIICLGEGRVMEEGTHAQLSRANGLYSYLLSLQDASSDV
jgi:subfamily B ATP-binding cassette protein HlyB/CyaB